MSPGISERTFEFCYNSEFTHRHMALLAAHPHIPSQRAEADLGYDVEFKLRSGVFTKSLFLQHKVAFYAGKPAGRNRAFFDAHAGPYFRFPIDAEQHNTLLDLAGSAGDVFYCAPVFMHRAELEAHFRAKQIAANSILIEPSSAGKIIGLDRHSITYDALGSKAFIHSEPKLLRSMINRDGEMPELRSHKIDKEIVSRIRNILLEHSYRRDTVLAAFHEVERESAVQQVQYILGKVFDVSWILIP